MERYLGLDVHAASCTLAVISEKGRKLRDFPVETNGQALVEAVRMIPGHNRKKNSPTTGIMATGIAAGIKAPARIATSHNTAVARANTNTYPETEIMRLLISNLASYFAGSRPCSEWSSCASEMM